MIIPISKLFEGSAVFLREGQIIVLYADITGTLKEVSVWLKSNITLGTALFDLSINGTKQFVGSEMSITVGERTDSKTGLNIAVTEGDFIALEYVSEATAGLSSPIALNLKIDDGIPTYTLEQFQDTVAAMFEDEDGTTVTYDDGTGKITVSSEIPLNQEQIEDIVAALVAEGTNITISYNDAGNELTFSSVGGSGDARYDLDIALSDEITPLTTGLKATVHAKVAFDIDDLMIGVTTVSSSGTITVDIKKNATSIFTTKITIDATESTSLTGTGYALTGAISFSPGDEITVFIDGAGTGAKGLKLYITGTL